LLRAGTSNEKIAELVNCSTVTVWQVKKLLEEGETLERKPGSGQPAKLNVEDVKNTFKANPTATISSVAEENGVSRSTMSRAVKKAGGVSLRRIERPLLSEVQRQTRLERANKLLNSLKHAPAGLLAPPESGS